MKSADPVSAFLSAKGTDVTAVLVLGRRILRWMLLVPAGLGGTFFLSICLTTFYKLTVGTIRLTDMPEFDPWVLLPVYGGFFAWGITIIMSALSHVIRTSRYTRSDL